MPKKSTKKTSAKTPSKKNSAPINVNDLKKDTRLIPLEEFDWSRLVYSEPKKGEVPDGSGNFRRVYIQYRYDDKTIGPAIVELGKHYCFGVQPDNTDKDGKLLKDKETGKEKPLRGYNVPIVMTSQNDSNPDPTPEEQREVDFLDEWHNEIVRYAIENKKAIGKGAKKDDQIDGMVGDLLYRKQNAEGEYIEGVAPKYYAKLKYYTKNKEVGTPFYGPGDKELNPLTMTGHFYIYPTIHFDNIFIGGKTVSLQHRVYDATIEPISRAPKKRLARKNEMEADADADSDGEDQDASAEDEDMMESEEDEE